jgi:biopolymer transport protein ExbD
MGPFADIAFLLIIFFILVTSMNKNLGFTTEIPASEKSEEQEEKTTTVKIKGEQVFLDDEGVTLKALHERLVAKNFPEKETDAEKTVMLEATGEVPYSRYFGTMAAISDAGGVIAIVQEE